MRHVLFLGLTLFACKREDTKVCPDPVTSPPAAKSVAPMRTIDVPLPKAIAFGTAEAVLNVTIEASGRTAVNGLAITDDNAIAEAAKKALSADPNVKAVILADMSVTHGRVIAVLDRLRMGGISKIAFAVSPWPP
jgi:biopolymer transport protein ExbD